jgi:hypothetical protein
MRVDMLLFDNSDLKIYQLNTQLNFHIIYESFNYFFYFLLNVSFSYVRLSHATSLSLLIS